MTDTQDREREKFNRTVAQLLQPFGVLPDHIRSTANYQADEEHGVPVVTVAVRMPTLTEDTLGKMGDVLAQVQGFSKGHCPPKSTSTSHLVVDYDGPGEGSIILAGDPDHIYRTFNALDTVDKTAILDFARKTAPKMGRGN